MEMNEQRATDKEVSAWWESVKDSDCWSGAIVNLSWDDLWDEAKDNLRVIYESSAARMTKHAFKRKAND